jgi:hypothetical protein
MAKKEETKGEKEEQKAKGGCMRTVLVLALLLLAILGVLTYLTFDPQNLSDIEGWREDVSPIPAPGRDLGKVLESALKGGHSATLTEREINHYLVNTLKIRQEGVFKERVELKGVWVRLTENRAEVIIEREIMGKKRHTISMFLEIEQRLGEKDQVTTYVHRSGGRFGRTEVPQGYLLIVMGAFDSLGAAYGDELAIFRQMFKGMTRVVIKEGELVLTPPES